MITKKKQSVYHQRLKKLKNEIKRRETLEDELSELNVRLLNALDISSDMILLINTNYQIVYANEHASAALQSKNDRQKGGSLLGQHIQNYLDEFCYKFNRRYFGDKLSDRLLIAALETTWYK